MDQDAPQQSMYVDLNSYLDANPQAQQNRVEIRNACFLNTIENPFSTTILPLSFSNCSFKKGLNLVNTAIPNNPNHYLSFSYCDFHEKLHLQNIHLNTLEFRHCELPNVQAYMANISVKSIRIQFKSCNMLSIHGKNSCDRFEIGNSNDTNIGTLLFNCRGFEGHLEIFNTYANSISLSDTLANGTITIQHCFAQSISLHDLVNKSQIIFKNIKRLPNINSNRTGFAIMNSIVGDLLLFDIDFTKFDHNIILNSDISTIRFVKVSWPNRLYSKAKPSQGEKEEYDLSEEQDTYRQLRHASSKQSDLQNEVFFHQKELNTYNLRIKGIKFFWTSLILRFSQKFGNYGQNFSQPFSWLFGIHTIVYFLMILFNYNHYQISFKEFDVNTTIDAIGEFFRLLNPLHTLGDVKGVWILVDTIIRIYTSYLIYNMIRATRRFIK